MTRTDDVQDFRNDEQRENPIGGAVVVDEEEVTNTQYIYHIDQRLL